jgi:hypothetical protein
MLMTTFEMLVYIIKKTLPMVIGLTIVGGSFYLAYIIIMSL